MMIPLLALLLPSPRCQTLDYSSLVLSVRELRPLFCPSRVESVVQTDDHNVLLSLKGASSGALSRSLLFNWHPRAARIGLGQAGQTTRSADAMDTTFATILNTHLRSRVLTGMHVLAFERRVVVEFSEKLSSGAQGLPSHKLIMEIAGPRSNLILVSSDNSILSCAYQVSGATSSRPVQIGSEYAPPPSTAAIAYALDPASVSFEQFWLLFASAKSASDRARTLLSCIRGMSPNVAEMILQSSAHSGDSDYSSPWDNEQAKLVYARLQLWTEALDGPSARVRPRATAYGFETIDLAADPASARVEQDSSCPVSELLSSYYRSYENMSKFTLLRSTCEKKLERLSRRGDKLRADFASKLVEAEGGQVDRLMREADLVTAFTYKWQSPQTVLECQDFVTGEAISVSVPPGSTPTLLADKLYARARRLRRSIKSLELLLAETVRQLSYLAEIQAAIDNFRDFYSLGDLVALKEIEDELDALQKKVFLDGLDREKDGKEESTSSKAPNKIKRSHLQKKRGMSTHDTVKSKQTASKSASKQAGQPSTKENKKAALRGLLVLRPDFEERVDDSSPLANLVVGRNSKQNERVTFEIGKEHHLWFHVQGFPGSHCLLQLNPGETASDECIQYAADVASYFSQGRGSTSVPVGFCSPKYVRKITGGAPGTVSILKQNGIVYGNPERGRVLAQKYGPKE